MDPPPLAQLKLMDDLVGFCQKWARNNGYTIAKCSSHPGKNVYIGCNCSGHYNRGSLLNKSGQQTALFKIDCPFCVKGSVPTSKKLTRKLWTLEIINASHNHVPLPGASSQPTHQQLMPEQ
jgi:hypothetical protein